MPAPAAAKKIVAITAAAGCIAAAPAAAQVKCTMPNGVTIVKNFGNCPHDAVAAYTLDGKELPPPSETPEAKAARERAAAQNQAIQERLNEAARKEHEAILEQWRKEAAEKKAREAEEANQRHQAATEAIIHRGCATLGLQTPQRCDTKIGFFSSPALILKVHYLNFDPHTACKEAAWLLRKELLGGRRHPDWDVRIEYTPTGKTIAECSL